MNKPAPLDRARDLDQFYTNPDYAVKFFDKVKEYYDIDSADIILEPSAGSGSFYNLFNSSKRVGLDLDPKAPGIIQQDFFTWVPHPNSKIVTIGNPPFGKNSSLAVKFFNYAAKFSDIIAFVLPRTFRKASIINRLHENFHLVYEEIVPDNSFIFNDKPYDVCCCSQIWIRKETVRPKITILNFDNVSDWFEIVEPKFADFAIQRVGGRAGLIRTSDFLHYSSQSHYFIKQKDPRVLNIFQSVDFEKVKYNTAGNPSVSPSELVQLWIEEAKHAGIDVKVFKNKKEKHILTHLIID